jgi:hypothetical protein
LQKFVGRTPALPLCLVSLSPSLAVSVAVSSWCSAVSSRVHKGRN